ncbi:hypothetical protein [Sphingomonas baiyangensis]|uniref:Uncharacterized protein n=1 Tax=Sphingomonas baiyangensis TaxID=2572576 RepID=A0A4U1L0G9_9SPHN|nr:hypothetical protein [Sphingomonas baiyangensis]TKD50239.1 hypothetical protein FBR43_05310 [Sphingomonas baiyangensis]
MNPIEAVSKAIQDLLPAWMAEDGSVEDADLARAALKALADNITPEMVEAGDWECFGEVRQDVVAIFRAMIATAIRARRDDV